MKGEHFPSQQMREMRSEAEKPANGGIRSGRRRHRNFEEISMKGEHFPSPELLIKSPERILKPKEEKKYFEFIRVRQTGKPVAYLRTEKEFYNRKFYVDERVLIPRPETEEMVEEAIMFLQKHPDLKTVIDLGIGSGNIAITIALELPYLHVIGLDISKEALAVARKNAKRLNCKNVKFQKSDLLMSLRPRAQREGSNLVILANLPYIGTKKNHFISEQTYRFEPHLSLFGGADGLDLYRRTWQQIKKMNIPVAAMFMEIGFSQAEPITKEATQTFHNYHLEIKNDLAGLPRIAVITHLQHTS